MDKQREQFEAWAEERGHDTECWPGEMIYKDPRTGNLWAAYKFGKEQAAQAAPVEAVVEYVEGKYGNRLVWLSPEAQAYTPVGTKLYTRPDWNAAVEAAAKVCDEIAEEHMRRVHKYNAESMPASAYEEDQRCCGATTCAERIRALKDQS